MNDMTPKKVDLSGIPTCDLNRELIRREGVQAVFLGPKDTLSNTVRGPAWVIVNRD